MAEPSECPYCGQPLQNQTAVKHLHESQERLEAKLRRELTREAESRCRQEDGDKA